MNGNPATHMAKAPFTYEYTVLPGDAGPVEITISGFDLAGNLGTLSAPAALEITPLGASVPLRAWPVVLSLLAAGVLVLTLRRRHAALPLALALLASPAMAASPVVSNVAFVQQPNATGTEVVITYDLIAPNGPCNITVSLSRDGGVDGFSFPVSSVTGDLTGVVTGTGKEILWDIAADYPNENIPNALLRVTADDGLAEYTLTYAAGAGGSLSGASPQVVVSGQSGSPVTAQANAGFHFVDWSDGSTANPRTDTNVTADLSVTANFAANLVEMLPVAADTFTMGSTGAGDDIVYTYPAENPAHDVTLSAYEIGRFEITNQQYCDVLNWAIHPSRNYLRDSANDVWTGTGNIYAGGDLQKLIEISHPFCNIEYKPNDGGFVPKWRFDNTLTELNVPTHTHAAHSITWFGAACFANWLSEMEGLTPVYDTTTAGWPANFDNNGYHLPTEAQWERAAAWDASNSKHWIYGFTADTLSGRARANYQYGTLLWVNPLGVSGTGFTSPVGWFNGENISPRGNVQTENSVSPVGAYDMTGNVFEWCHDWYSNTYYGDSPAENPTGPSNGSMRVWRGANWGQPMARCRTACRDTSSPDAVETGVGFRLARTLH